MRRLPLLVAAALLAAAPAVAQEAACTDGQAFLPDIGSFPCKDVNLVGYLSVAAFQSPGSPAAAENNDIWGWTDPESGIEYALVGTQNGVGFVDLSTPTAPRYLGKLPSASNASVWRDIKVYQNHAFVVADNSTGHGMQVFDLTRLRSVPSPPVTFTADARYTGFGAAHNVVVNESTGFAYGVGSTVTPGLGLPPSCTPRGFHAVNIQDPKAPVFAGCFSDVALETGTRSPGYTHDAQCVTYSGPDTDYTGREICFGANEDVVTIFDATDKTNAQVIAQVAYPTPSYTHQGWLTEDQAYFLTNDELDERNGIVATQRTLVLDVADLDNPGFDFSYDSGLTTIDHNLYVRGPYAFESNYETGLRILDISGIENGTIQEVAYFDTYPIRDATAFNGAWSVYPYFASGLVLINDINSGLFVVRPTSLRALPGEDTPPTPPATSFSLSDPVPNPAATGARLTLRVDASQPVEAVLFDVAGRTIRTLFAGEAIAGRDLVLTVDAGDLPAGVYLVRVTGETTTVSRRLVLTR